MPRKGEMLTLTLTSCKSCSNDAACKDLINSALAALDTFAIEVKKLMKNIIISSLKNKIKRGTIYLKKNAYQN